MLLKEEKIPKWKEKEDKMKKSSFDQALGKLGVNQRFTHEEEAKEQEKEKPVLEEEA